MISIANLFTIMISIPSIILWFLDFHKILFYAVINGMQLNDGYNNTI